MKIATILVFACFHQALDSPVAEPEETLSSIIERFAKVEDGESRSKLYRQLFKRAVAAEGLRSLQTAKDDSIAIQSAWEQVMPNADKESEKSVPPPDKAQLKWFVGFFEGRTRVIPPGWWSDGIVDRDVRFADALKHGPWRSNSPYHRSGNGSFACPSDATIDKVEESHLYRVGSDKVTIPAILLDRSRGFGSTCISGAFTKTHCFIAVHDEFGLAHELACVERSTNKLLWKATVCGAWRGGGSGQHESWVRIVASDDGRVFVFGSAATGSYAHGFRIHDGRSLVQFSTNY